MCVRRVSREFGKSHSNRRNGFSFARTEASTLEAGTVELCSTQLRDFLSRKETFSDIPKFTPKPLHLIGTKYHDEAPTSTVHSDK